VGLQSECYKSTISLCLYYASCRLRYSNHGSIKCRAPAIPKYYFFGGFFVVFYILSITWAAPKFGIGNAISFVLLGQLISMAIIDQFSLLGAPYYAITIKRFLGLIFMVTGVVLVVFKAP